MKKTIQKPSVSFKPYHQHQTELLPPSLEELIPERHLVRVVNRFIEQMDLSALFGSYRGGGTSSYHPRMMLKVLIYAYVSKIYSSRQIAKALREQIPFMWLSGNNRPDFRTLNRFRGERMKGVVDEVFSSLMELLVETGHVNLSTYFVDGSKFRADANKNSYIWRKNTLRYKARNQAAIQALLSEIDAQNAAEESRYGDRDLEELGETSELNSGMLETRIRELNERLAARPKDRALKRVVRKLEQECLPRQKKYEDQEQRLQGRNSSSKTDADATFMRRKDDRLLPSYNVMLGTETQFIVGYSVHQQPSDSAVFMAHMEKSSVLRKGHLPAAVVGDAGFGSEENYHFLEQQGIENYLKYNTFHREQGLKYRQDKFRKENFQYDEASDSYQCQGGRRLEYLKSERSTTQNGYKTEEKIYECKDCSGCPFESRCCRAQGNRRIQVRPALDRYRQQARDNLKSEYGRKLRAQRSVDVETVFGDIKQNGQYRRIRLRGLDKVNLEFGLLSIAHNLKKIALS